MHRLTQLVLILTSAICLASAAVGQNSASASPQANTPAGAQNDAKTRIVPTDLFRLRSVTSIDVDRNGFNAVFSVRSMHGNSGAGSTGDGSDASGDAAPQALPQYEYRSHLYIVDLTNRRSTPRQLTTGDRRDSGPVLSPDGNFVAFTRQGSGDEDGAGRAQVWILPLGGGEAWQLTNLEHGASSPVWSPDGHRLLVTSSIPESAIEGDVPWPSERPVAGVFAAADDAKANVDGSIAEVRAWLKNNGSSYDPFVLNGLRFQGEQSLRRERRVRHAFVIDFSDARQPIDATQVTDGFFDCNSPVFTLAGDQLVYSGSKDTTQHPDRVRATQLWQIDIDGSNERVLLSIDGMRLGQPRLNSTGAFLGFTGSGTDEPTYRQRRLGVMAMSEAGNNDPSAVSWLTEDDGVDGAVHGSVSSFRWLPTRMGVVYGTARQGGFPLMTVTASLVEPVEFIARAHDDIGGLPIGINAFDLGGGATVYAQTSVDNPCTLRVRDALGDRELMDLNPWVETRMLSTPRRGILSRPDSTEVEYWIMPPAEFDETMTYPLALEIHGGPMAMWGPGEQSMWFEFQLLCSWGYGVVYANPRGSGGYGYRFQKGNHENWGDGPAGDVLAAVDAAMLEPWVDSNRMVMTGGSYGGYLTAWIASQDHRFKAAVAQRGVYELSTFFGEGNAYTLVEHTMGGLPWEARTRTVLQRESPFTYVHRIRTPMLIMHGSNDLRTGVSQSEMMYRALKKLEKPVEYVRYPNTGHDLSRTGQPNRRLDRLMRIVEFFERHVGDMPSSE